MIMDLPFFLLMMSLKSSAYFSTQVTARLNYLVVDVMNIKSSAYAKISSSGTISPSLTSSGSKYINQNKQEAFPPYAPPLDYHIVWFPTEKWS